MGIRAHLRRITRALFSCHIYVDSSKVGTEIRATFPVQSMSDGWCMPAAYDAAFARVVGSIAVKIAPCVLALPACS